MQFPWDALPIEQYVFVYGQPPLNNSEIPRDLVRAFMVYMFKNHPNAFPDKSDQLVDQETLSTAYSNYLKTLSPAQQKKCKDLSLSNSPVFGSHVVEQLKASPNNAQIINAFYASVEMQYPRAFDEVSGVAVSSVTAEQISALWQVYLKKLPENLQAQTNQNLTSLVVEQSQDFQLKPFSYVSCLQARLRGSFPALLAQKRLGCTIRGGRPDEIMGRFTLTENSTRATLRANKDRRQQDFEEEIFAYELALGSKSQFSALSAKLHKQLSGNVTEHTMKACGEVYLEFLSPILKAFAQDKTMSDALMAANIPWISFLNDTVVNDFVAYVQQEELSLFKKDFLTALAKKNSQLAEKAKSISDTNWREIILSGVSQNKSNLIITEAFGLRDENEKNDLIAVIDELHAPTKTRVDQNRPFPTIIAILFQNIFSGAVVEPSLDLNSSVDKYLQHARNCNLNLLEAPAITSVEESALTSMCPTLVQIRDIAPEEREATLETILHASGLTVDRFQVNIPLTSAIPDSAFIGYSLGMSDKELREYFFISNIAYLWNIGHLPRASQDYADALARLKQAFFADNRFKNIDETIRARLSALSIAVKDIPNLASEQVVLSGLLASDDEQKKAALIFTFNEILVQQGNAKTTLLSTLTAILAQGGGAQKNLLALLQTMVEKEGVVKENFLNILPELFSQVIKNNKNNALDALVRALKEKKVSPFSELFTRQVNLSCEVGAAPAWDDLFFIGVTPEPDDVTSCCNLLINEKARLVSLEAYWPFVTALSKAISRNVSEKSIEPLVHAVTKDNSSVLSFEAEVYPARLIETQNENVRKRLREREESFGETLDDLKEYSDEDLGVLKAALTREYDDFQEGALKAIESNQALIDKAKALTPPSEVAMDVLAELFYQTALEKSVKELSQLTEKAIQIKTDEYQKTENDDFIEKLILDKIGSLVVSKEIREVFNTILNSYLPLHQKLQLLAEIGRAEVDRNRNKLAASLKNFYEGLSFFSGVKKENVAPQLVEFLTKTGVSAKNSKEYLRFVWGKLKKLTLQQVEDFILLIIGKAKEEATSLVGVVETILDTLKSLPTFKEVDKNDIPIFLREQLAEIFYQTSKRGDVETLEGLCAVFLTKASAMNTGEKYSYDETSKAVPVGSPKKVSFKAPEVESYKEVNPNFYHQNYAKNFLDSLKHKEEIPGYFDNAGIEIYLTSQLNRASLNDNDCQMLRSILESERLLDGQNRSGFYIRLNVLGSIAKGKVENADFKHKPLSIQNFYAQLQIFSNITSKAGVPGVFAQYLQSQKLVDQSVDNVEAYVQRYILIQAGLRLIPTNNDSRAQEFLSQEVFAALESFLEPLYFNDPNTVFERINKFQAFLTENETALKQAIAASQSVTPDDSQKFKTLFMCWVQFAINMKVSLEAKDLAWMGISPTIEDVISCRAAILARTDLKENKQRELIASLYRFYQEKIKEAPTFKEQFELWVDFAKQTGEVVTPVINVAPEVKDFQECYVLSQKVFGLPSTPPIVAPTVNEDADNASSSKIIEKKKLDDQRNSFTLALKEKYIESFRDGADRWERMTLCVDFIESKSSYFSKEIPSEKEKHSSFVLAMADDFKIMFNILYGKNAWDRLTEKGEINISGTVGSYFSELVNLSSMPMSFQNTFIEEIAKTFIDQNPFSRKKSDVEKKYLTMRLGCLLHDPGYFFQWIENQSCPSEIESQYIDQYRAHYRIADPSNLDTLAAFCSGKQLNSLKAALQKFKVAKTTSFFSAQSIPRGMQEVIHLIDKKPPESTLDILAKLKEVASTRAHGTFFGDRQFETIEAYKAINEFFDKPTSHSNSRDPIVSEERPQLQSISDFDGLIQKLSALGDKVREKEALAVKKGERVDSSLVAKL